MRRSKLVLVTTMTWPPCLSRLTAAHGFGSAPLAGGGRWHTGPRRFLGHSLALPVGLRTLARANPDAIDGDDREGCGQFASARCEQGHHQPCLIGVGKSGETQEHDTCRGPSSKKDQLAEVLVRCEQDGGEGACAFENLIIVDPGGNLGDVGDIVPSGTQCFHHEGWDVLIRNDHDAASTLSILTACAANRRASWTSSRTSSG